jgi:hypothetical protein
MLGLRTVLMPYKAERTMKSITPTAINHSPIAPGAVAALRLRVGRHEAERMPRHFKLAATCFDGLI